jgi:hypothetical protein
MKKLTLLQKTGTTLLSVGFFGGSSMLLAQPVLAHCPLCVAGAAAGITLTRWVGVDDSITGVWIAALLGAMSFWAEKWVSKKMNVKRMDILRPLLYVSILLSTIWSFYQFNLVVRMSQIFGLDKLTFGMLAGSVLFYVIDMINDSIIKKNGKVFFPYQRLIVSLGSMIILSLLIYILINFII